MKMIRFNGEWWYEESLLHFLLMWICWPGGWLAHRKSPYHSLRQRLSPDKLTPISFLGHRLPPPEFSTWGCGARGARGTLTAKVPGRRWGR